RMRSIIPIAPFAVLLLVVWVWMLTRNARNNTAPPRRGAWGQAIAQRNSIDMSRTYNPKTEVHVNPISAVIFIIFIGGAVLARLANMPISVSVVLALIGIFLGYSVKMAQ